MDNGSRTRVALFSHNPFVSEGLCSVFGRSPDLQLATWSRDLSEFAASLADQKPDIALLDLATGLNLLGLRDVRRRGTNLQTVLWGDPTIEFGFHAMEMGVRGIIPAATPIESFTAALSSIRTGQLSFEKSLMEQLLLTKRVSLTGREGQLVGLISKGLKNKELAYALGITEGTVKVYLSRLYMKLGVNDRFELALYALKNVVSGQNGAVDLAPKPHKQDRYQLPVVGPEPTHAEPTIFPLRSVVLPTPGSRTSRAGSTHATYSPIRNPLTRTDGNMAFPSGESGSPTNARPVGSSSPVLP
jgi:DNA-binding NarL/FixJ family response regulator